MSDEMRSRARPEEPARGADDLRLEVERLRAAARQSPERARELEARLAHLQTSLTNLASQNERLVRTLKDAREQIVTLKAEVDRLAQPPSTYGLIVDVADDGTVDVLTGGRKMRVAVSPSVQPDQLGLGREVMLNEALNVVAVHGYERVGEVVTIKDRLGEDRVVVVTHGDEERVCRLADVLRGTAIRVGDSLSLDARSNFVYELIPKLEVEELVLEEIPDVAYEDIGGLSAQIEEIRDAVELPFLHPELFREHALKPPKGVLLYGPPGCGKTLIAKAVAASLARQMAARSGAVSEKSYFLNIKGPELLNKYVGETERHIRLIFQRAREKASDGTPVVVFFDEMDSLFRTRGSGVSSDVETTIVPQLLAEIDGVERLENVIVIGASNREDMIDPAILRPGRLDVKIKIERPNEAAATQIFSRYLTEDLPLDEGEVQSLGAQPLELEEGGDVAHGQAGAGGESLGLHEGNAAIFAHLNKPAIVSLNSVGVEYESIMGREDLKTPTVGENPFDDHYKPVAIPANTKNLEIFSNLIPFAAPKVNL